MYLNYKDTDTDYALKCLSAAKELYRMGKENPGYGQVQSTYVSGSFYDDLAWAALWLYHAEHEKQYLSDAEEFIVNKNRNNDPLLMTNWTLCWDDVTLACLTELYTITKNPKYKDALDYNLNYWKNDLKKTRGGLKYLNRFGVLRYTANASLIAMKWYKTTNDKSLKDLQNHKSTILWYKPFKNLLYCRVRQKYPKTSATELRTGMIQLN
jgi:uncharacterized protein YyaL (SSP411 family)